MQRRERFVLCRIIGCPCFHLCRKVRSTDDGISGTTFERPGVKRLLDDAKQGIINTILVKDMSRFGRNYILVGQYLDYVFPTFGIRFVALSDNIDTENKDTTAMDMMPITKQKNVCCQRKKRTIS